MKKETKRSPSRKTSSFKDMHLQNKEPLPQLRLSTEELGQLIAFADMERAADSPIPADVAPIPAQRALIDRLVENEWAEDGAEKHVLTPQANEALMGLLAPKTSVQLMLGSIKEFILTDLYSSSGFDDGALAAYAYHEEQDLHIITPGQSPSDVSDALLSQLMNGPHLEGLNFELNLGAEPLLVFLAMLDLIYARQLEAKLQADNYAILTFNADDAWQRFARLRIGEDYLWCSVLVPMLFPYLQQPLAEKEFKSFLPALVEEGLLTMVEKGQYQPSDFSVALAEGLLPMISFASCAVMGKEEQGLHMGFIIGLNVNLALQAFPDGDKNIVVLMGMDGVRLSRLLFEIGLPEMQEEVENA